LLQSRKKSLAFALIEHLDTFAKELVAFVCFVAERLDCPDVGATFRRDNCHLRLHRLNFHLGFALCSHEEEVDTRSEQHTNDGDKRQLPADDEANNQVSDDGHQSADNH
jgi:hypothetical protein